MADINLLPTEEKSSEGFNSLQKKLTIFSVVILVAVAAFTVTTLVLFTAAKSSESKLKARIDDAAGSVTSNQLTEELLTVVDKKASSATQVLDSRLLYTDILTKTAELMPTDVYFSDLKVTGTKITTNAKAKTSADVANLVSSFVTSEQGKKLFSSVSIDALGTDQDSHYTFSVSMVINAKQVPQAPTSASGGTQ